MSIWTKFRFILSSGSEEDFQRLPIFKLFRSHGSHLGCRARSPNIILVDDHPSFVQFGPVVLEKKINRRQCQ